MKEVERDEAHTLASVLFSMMLLGILVATVDIVTSPLSERKNEVYGGLMTLAVLAPSYLLARTPFYRAALLLAIIAYDFVAVLGFISIPQPFFLGYFLIPILLSALFASRRTALIVTTLNLAMAIFLSQQITERSFMETLQAGMLPVLFNTVLILAWSQFSRENTLKERRRLQFQHEALLQEHVSLEDELTGRITALSEENTILRRELDAVHKQTDAIHERSITDHTSESLSHNGRQAEQAGIDRLVADPEERSSGAPDSPLETLTPREQELLQLMVDGLSNDDIAKSLVITVQTVRNHARNIYRKLDASSRVEAVLIAMHWGMKPSSDSVERMGES